MTKLNALWRQYAPTIVLFLVLLATWQAAATFSGIREYLLPSPISVWNALWTGEIAWDRDPGITVGRDPQTGKIIRRRPPDKNFFQVGMPHHRCFRNRAAGNFLVLARAGIELLDVSSGQINPNHWIRGTCQFGVLPCNGLLYVPPHSCACYNEAKLDSFNVLAGAMSREVDESKSETPRLERVPRTTSPLSL